MAEKIKVVIGQLGSPKSTKTSDVREYLKEFLGDPRVVDAHPLYWKIILNLFILPFRPKRSAMLYSRIYEEGGFPLITNTEKVAEALRPKLDPNLELNHAFILSTPRTRDILDEWEKEDFFTRAQKVLFLPQFPQYSESTVASVMDTIGGEFKKRVNIPSFTIVNSYHRSRAFIDNSVRKIHEAMNENPDMNELVISFHGIPLRRVIEKKDIYLQHCLETFELLKERLHINIPISMTFQSRFGSEVWLGPYTDGVVIEKVKKGSHKIGVYCPSFVVDCLETTDEIGTELGHEVEQVGGKLVHIPCLNADTEWISDYANFINVYANGDETDRHELFYKIDVKERYQQVIKDQEKLAPSKLPDRSKKILKLMFTTMFLGF